MRSSRIIQGSIKSKDECPQRSQAEQRRGGRRRAEEEPGAMRPQAKDCLEPSGAGSHREDPPLEPSEVTQRPPWLWDVWPP